MIGKFRFINASNDVKLIVFIHFGNRGRNKSQTTYFHRKKEKENSESIYWKIHLLTRPKKMT